LKILGIVAEYDPFHNGHLYHLREARARSSPDLTYVVLSPCFKQRGTLALLSPFDRARCALESGADAVFSLPVLWTVRDAEHYALGAVSLLAGLGVTHLAFGAETADQELLSRTADFLESPDSVFESVLKSLLSSGYGYPAAVSAALSAALPEAAGLLDQPNNTLAVCYLRAVRRLGLSLQPVVIPRRGSYHAASVDPESPSATALREHLDRGSYTAAFRAMPETSVCLLRRRFLEGRVPDRRILDILLISGLRSMSADTYRQLPGLSEGMENALYRTASTVNTREELLSALSGKRYPAARISRLCACVLLGVTGAQLDGLPLPESTLLLGLRKNPSMTVLWKDLRVSVIPSASEWQKTAHPADLSAWRLWARCCGLPDTLPCSEKTVTL